MNEKGMKFKIATKEKALLDLLYSKYPVRSITDLKIMLFDDLHVDEIEFRKLDFQFMKCMIDKYHSNTLKMLKKYIDEVNNDK